MRMLAAYMIIQTFSGYNVYCKLLEFTECWNKMHIKCFPDCIGYMHAVPDYPLGTVGICLEAPELSSPTSHPSKKKNK
jgi:hypothetical protein